MRTVRYLYANLNLLNILLLLAITATVLFAVLPVFRLKANVALPQIKAKAVAEETVSPEKTQTPSPVDYAMVGENNLFHPERRIPPLKTEEAALPKPELVLYGTIIGDGTAVAYIEDKKAPKTTPGRGNRQQAVKKGDVLSGFVVREIVADRITLTRGEETMTVHLSQEKKGRGSETAAGASRPPAPGTPRPPQGGAVPPRAAPTPQPAARPNIAQPGQAAPPAPPAQRPVTRSRREGLYGP